MASPTTLPEKGQCQYNWKHEYWCTIWKNLHDMHVESTMICDGRIYIYIYDNYPISCMFSVLKGAQALVDYFFFA